MVRRVHSIGLGSAWCPWPLAKCDRIRGVCSANLVPSKRRYAWTSRNNKQLAVLAVLLLFGRQNRKIRR